MAKTNLKKIRALPKAVAKTDTRLAIALATAAFAGGAALVAWALGRRGERIAGEMFPPSRDDEDSMPAGDQAPDLAPEAPRPTSSDRAPTAFRPDATAPVPAAERAAFAPATMPNPAAVTDGG